MIILSIIVTIVVVSIVGLIAHIKMTSELEKSMLDYHNRLWNELSQNANLICENSNLRYKLFQVESDKRAVYGIIQDNHKKNKVIRELSDEVNKLTYTIRIIEEQK